MNGYRCPEWCAKDHQCTARQGAPSGVHRSDPIRWTCTYGSLVVVRNQDLSGRDWLEIHGHVRLGDTTLPTQEQASRLAVEVDAAIRRIALPPKKSQPVITDGGQRGLARLKG